MRPGNYRLVIAAILGALIAAYGWHTRPPVIAATPLDVFDRVVAPPAMQTLLAGGDPFLAANFEAIRALTSLNDSPDAIADNLSFVIRSRTAVSQLNPCHEDNYYIANALITWGGDVETGNAILKRASDCRIWDEFPPFYLAFNLYYFLDEKLKATEIMNLAADRSKENAAPLRKFAVMLTAETMPDDAAALSYLEGERDRAKDPKLHEMLEKRVLRLRGLIYLKEAQARYEQQTSRQLTDPRQLIESGIISAFPSDPIKIGYEFHNGHFRMKEITFAGMERKKR